MSSDLPSPRKISSQEKRPKGSRGLGVYQATRARQARAASEQSIEVNCIGQGFRPGKR